MHRSWAYAEKVRESNAILMVITDCELAASFEQQLDCQIAGPGMYYRYEWKHQPGVGCTPVGKLMTLGKSQTCGCLAAILL